MTIRPFVLACKTANGTLNRILAVNICIQFVYGAPQVSVQHAHVHVASKMYMCTCVFSGS